MAKYRAFVVLSCNLLLVSVNDNVGYKHNDIPLNALAVHTLGNASKYLWYISVESHFCQFYFHSIS